jgi:hypothetical protein
LKEPQMNIGEQSLRLLVEKWFAPTAETPVRITRFGRTHANQERCIRVETLRTEGAVAIFSSGTMTVSGAFSRLKSGAKRCVLMKVHCDRAVSSAINGEHVYRFIGDHPDRRH